MTQYQLQGIFLNQWWENIKRNKVLLIFLITVYKKWKHETVIIIFLHNSYVMTFCKGILLKSTTNIYLLDIIIDLGRWKKDHINTTKTNVVITQCSYYHVIPSSTKNDIIFFFSIIFLVFFSKRIMCWSSQTIVGKLRRLVG